MTMWRARHRLAALHRLFGRHDVRAVDRVRRECDHNCSQQNCLDETHPKKKVGLIEVESQAGVLLCVRRYMIYPIERIFSRARIGAFGGCDHVSFWRE